MSDPYVCYSCGGKRIWMGTTCPHCGGTDTTIPVEIYDDITDLRNKLKQAVEESNRRDQKWMDGIDSIVGRKLRYTLATITDPPGFDLVPDLQDFIADLRARLQAAEQQLGQVREEAKGLRGALRIDEPWALWHVINSLCDAVDYAFNKYDMRPDGWEVWSHNAQVGREIATQLEALSSTPSDGCGKGRTDKERLDWLEKTKGSLEWHFELDYEAQTKEWFWEIRDGSGGSLSDEEDLREAIDKAMEAASSIGKEGGE